jgi:hypothetical protein
MSLKPERLEAKKLYVDNLFSIETIQKILSKKVSRKTLYNWKNNYDGLDESDWDKLRRQKFSEAKDIKEGLKEVIKALIAEIKIDPKNAMLHFALPKYLTSFRYYDDFENLFKEMNGEEKEDAKKVITPETIKQVDEYLRGGH